MAGFFYFSLGIACRAEGWKLDFHRGRCACLFSLGLIFVVAQAVFVIKAWPGAQHFGWLAIPLMLYGVWGLMPTCALPQWFVGCAFPVYLLHKFFFPIADRLWNGVTGATTIIGYLATIVFVFGASVVAANLLRRLMPRVSGVAFGGR